ncbi:conserved exported hypothetical protein [Vibrio chagasii]|nr:conserved exported hypothetical protein [Vibrio chagasii]CAH6839058.1 conserved exported hypothetical protein [Vibrio chagasii]CAH6862361.1 conserved exported hypothetical protein [Vibrio chagasii]CAH6891127.1 conserved exported hypothetical protein [Vibrio chagasii]CAH7045186.1 conserved exported hypothetical protein [Vibrio chagasii]
MKKLPITLLSAAAVANVALAEDHVSVHYLNYEEYDDRVSAKDTMVSIEKSIGLDWTLNAEISYDSVSGASPAWGPTTPPASDADKINRALKTQQAQDKTNEVIRAGYDPHRDSYEVQKVGLEDTRKALSLSATYRDRLRNEWTFGGNISQEEDYESIGINGKGLIYADSTKNRSYSLGGSALFDQTQAFGKYVIGSSNSQSWEDIFTGSLEAGLSQTFTPNLYSIFTAYAGYRSGYLSNHYLTVLREVDINDDGKIDDDEVFLGQDSRPDTRLSGGINLQAFYSLSDSIKIRPRYKWFMDDWGVMSHQIGGKLSWRVSEWLTLAPGYFWYTQDAADFYRDPSSADPSFASTGYATSDLRLGNFTANAYELGASVKVHKTVRLNALAAYYEQSNGFEAQWWAVGATYEF